jgi:2-oxo-3-hexenedioate decarboxylase/2-keto-4-pentenoate hydratase
MTSFSDSARNAAQIIASARVGRIALERLPDDCRPSDEAAGYDVQDALHAALADRGWGRLAGYKIGCTTAVMQAHLSLTSPCGGGIFASRVHHGTVDLVLADYVRVGCETEIAVRMGADLAGDLAPFDRNSVASAVDSCMAAMEIVDNRYVDSATMGTATLIADDFFGAGCLLGEPLVEWRDLDLGAVIGHLLVDGVEIGQGRGADVMGHPFEALAWLANTLATRGRMLKRGDIVLTGSLVQVHYPAPGESVDIVIDGLGEVHAHFS